MAGSVRVLFLCTGNSARSIIAEALLKKLGGPGFDVSSAGTRPKGINPYTVRVLDEVDVDCSGARSKHVDEFTDASFDYVITVCDQAAEECPVFPGTERLHWSLADPAKAEGTEEEKLAAFRQTVNDMSLRISSFIPTAEATRIRT